MNHFDKNIFFLAVGKKKGKKAGKLTIDPDYLACQHHISMIAGLGFIPDIHQMNGKLIS